MNILDISSAAIDSVLDELNASQIELIIARVKAKQLNGPTVNEYFNNFESAFPLLHSFIIETDAISITESNFNDIIELPGYQDNLTALAIESMNIKKESFEIFTAGENNYCLAA